MMLVVIVSLLGCDNQKVTSIDNSDVNDFMDDESLEENKIINKKITKLSSEEKFVQFGADIACERLKYTEAIREVKNDPDFRNQMESIREEYLKTTNSIAEKYGYKEGEAESLSQEYEEDIDYAKKVIERVKELCPKAAPELEQNIAIMESGMSVKIIINEADDSAMIEYKYFEDGYINSGSRDSSANMEDIHNIIRERFGEELGNQMIDVAKYEYE